MKKQMLLGMLLLIGFGATAQDKKTTSNDTVGRKATTTTSRNVNRANRVEVPEMQAKSEVEAEKKAKNKGSNRNQTQVNPEKMTPILSDTIKKPNPIRN